MSDVPAMPVQTSRAQPTLLCVDDEPNILASLRRLFRAKGYRVLAADGGNAGLHVLETEVVDLVISDMRMPEMDGVLFLEHVRARWPDTMRVLLTGYADVQSIIEAINRGEIYRYITKPWDDNDMLLLVRDALERQDLQREKLHLEALTRRQNDELKNVNANLEAKVLERTVELKKAHDALLAANERLKTNFLTSIKVFSNLIEMRAGNLAGHSRRVADLARKIAVKMELDGREIQEVFIASLMLDIGKIGFPDELLIMPVSAMSGENLGSYRKYAARGEQLLMPLEDLRGAAKIIRSQLERFDGTGFPDGLSGTNIPLGARILALASDYDSLQAGTLVQRRFRPEEASANIIQGSGRRYDPAVVKAFREVVDVEEVTGESVMTAFNLRPGMILARDLINRDGLLMLSADHVLNARLIQQILDFEKTGGVPLSVSVRLDRRV